jgi:superfamily I DNA/RNA helicase
LEQTTESGIPVSLTPQALRERIMLAKQSMIAPKSPAGSNPSGDFGFFSAYQAYQGLLESQRQSDFEDLIFKVVSRLEVDSRFLKTCRDRFRHVLVDEYQDLNRGQYRMIRALKPSHADGGSLCVIGDPDQSIYGFRGSDPLYFSRFLEDYPDASVVTLFRNYRSTETILSASHQIITHGVADRPRIYSNIDGIKTISVLELPNEYAEAECIARIIESLVGGTGFHSFDTGRVGDPHEPAGFGYADFAVLMRTNEQVRVMADGFKKFGIPFQTANRRHLFKRPGIIELFSLLRLISSTGGYADVMRVADLITPGLGKKVLRTFKQWGLKKRLAAIDALSATTRFPISGLSRNQQLRLSEFTTRLSAITHETAHIKASETILRL